MKRPGVEAEIICKGKWQGEVDEGYTVFGLDCYRIVLVYQRTTKKKKKVLSNVEIQELYFRNINPPWQCVRLIAGKNCNNPGDENLQEVATMCTKIIQILNLGYLRECWSY